jgi:hypothetical protein
MDLSRDNRADVRPTLNPPTMLKLLYLLLTVAARARSAAVSPGITYAFRIEDFQGHMLDLSDGSPQPFTPVQSFTPANTTNQQVSVKFFKQVD